MEWEADIKDSGDQTLADSWVQDFFLCSTDTEEPQKKWQVCLASQTVNTSKGINEGSEDLGCWKKEWNKNHWKHPEERKELWQQFQEQAQSQQHSFGFWERKPHMLWNLKTTPACVKLFWLFSNNKCGKADLCTNKVLPGAFEAGNLNQSFAPFPFPSENASQKENQHLSLFCSSDVRGWFVGELIHGSKPAQTSGQGDRHFLFFSSSSGPGAWETPCVTLLSLFSVPSSGLVPFLQAGAKGDSELREMNQNFPIWGRTDQKYLKYQQGPPV